MYGKTGDGLNIAFATQDNDYIVCGSCQKEFPLNNFSAFIQHKKYDCDECSKGSSLSCHFCHRKCSSPWKLLKHVQTAHSVTICNEAEPAAEQLSNCDVLNTSNLHRSFEPMSCSLTLNDIDILLNEQTGSTTSSNPHISESKSHFVSSAQRQPLSTGNYNTESENCKQESLAADVEKFKSKMQPVASVSPLGNSFFSVSDKENEGLQLLSLYENSKTSMSISTAMSGGAEMYSVRGSHESCLNRNSAHNFHTTNDCITESIPAEKVYTGHFHVNSGIDSQSDGLQHQQLNSLYLTPVKEKFTTISTESLNLLESIDNSCLGHPALSSDGGTSLEGGSDELGIGTMSFQAEAEHVAFIDGGIDCFQSCDNLDCGITLIPGNHEEAKDCCHAVVPKKRKQHMATQHMTSAKQRGDEPSAGSPSSSPVKPHNTSFSTLFDENFGSTCDSFNASELLEDSKEPYSTCLPAIASYISTSGYSNKAVQGNGKHPQLQSFNSGELIASDSNNKDENYFDYHSNEGTSVQNPAPLVQAVLATAAIEIQNTQNPEENCRIRKNPKRAEKVVKRKRQYPTSRPFKCETCGQAFNQLVHLKKHQQSKHTGDKPFKCPHCTYSTVEKSHLKVHLRIHTGEKPFKCSYCDYATSQSGTLKMHVTRHHSAAAAEDNLASTIQTQLN